MSISTRKIKPFVLPCAIVFGLLLHNLCGKLSGIVPFLIFSILILTFSTTRLSKLKFEKLDVWLMGLQTTGAVFLYLGAWWIWHNDAVAQGIMLGALCPVASSVTVVAVLLGAKKENTVAYTIVGNLLICVLAPLVFVFIDDAHSATIFSSFLTILGRITMVIGLPFFIMLAIQILTPALSDKINKISGLSFYLWAMALFLTLGQTIDFIFREGQGHWDVIVILGITSAIICPLQFYIGRKVGKRCGDSVAGQQLLGQKNSAMGIWMANTYLNPLASSFLAFYSIWQNLLNSWQIWVKTRKNQVSG